MEPGGEKSLCIAVENPEMKVIDDVSSVHPWHPLVLKNARFFMLKYRCGSFDNSIKSCIHLCGNKQVSKYFPTVVEAAVVRAVDFLGFG